jgi:hypothetical protein
MEEHCGACTASNQLVSSRAAGRPREQPPNSFGGNVEPPKREDEMEKTIRFSSASPSHSYTYYHECEGRVTFHDDGRVTVVSDMTDYTGIHYKISALGLTPHVSFAKRPTTTDDGRTVFVEDLSEITFDSIDAAEQLFRSADHNGAGAHLRKILKEARTSPK